MPTTIKLKLPNIYSVRLVSVLLTTSFPLSAPPLANSTELLAGVYENVVIAVNSSGSVMGRYQENQGEGVSKNCSFFIQGGLRAGQAKVITWSDHVLPGVLTAVPGGIELKVQNGREHAGCGLVMLTQISEGIRFDLLRRTNWVEVRTVSAVHAMLQSQPGARQKPIASLPKGTTLGVLAEKGGWLLVESADVEGRERVGLKQAKL